MNVDGGHLSLPFLQEASRALTEACNSASTPAMCMDDMMHTAAATGGPQMHNQDTAALVTAMHAMCMHADGQQPCILRAMQALQGTVWTHGYAAADPYTPRCTNTTHRQPDITAAACRSLAAAGSCAGNALQGLEPFARGAMPTLGAALHALPATCARLGEAGVAASIQCTRHMVFYYTGVRLPMDAAVTAEQVVADEVASVDREEAGWVRATRHRVLDAYEHKQAFDT